MFLADILSQSALVVGTRERDDFLTCLLWSFDIYREMKTKHADSSWLACVT